MLGRRDFLQRLAASAAVLALDPFRDILIADDAYQNARLGLRVLRPDGREFSSIADFAALRERQVIQGILDDDPHPLKIRTISPCSSSRTPLAEMASTRHRYPCGTSPCTGLSRQTRLAPTTKHPPPRRPRRVDGGRLVDPWPHASRTSRHARLQPG